MDLIAGPTRGSGAALLTLVERKSRQVLLRKRSDQLQARALEAWLNNYPRCILGFKTPNLLFQDELRATA